eukprot:s5665_g9.t1
MALIIDHNIQMPAKFVDKLARNRRQQQNPQPRQQQVIQHLITADYMNTGQTSVRDQPLPEKELARITRPAEPKSQERSTWTQERQSMGEQGHAREAIRLRIANATESVFALGQQTTGEDVVT